MKMKKRKRQQLPVGRNQIPHRIGEYLLKQHYYIGVDPQWLLELMWLDDWLKVNENYCRRFVEAAQQKTITIQTTPDGSPNEDDLILNHNSIPLHDRPMRTVNGSYYGRLFGSIVIEGWELKDEAASDPTIISRHIHPKFVINNILHTYEQLYGCNIPPKAGDPKLIRNTLRLLESLRFPRKEMLPYQSALANTVLKDNPQDYTLTFCCRESSLANCGAIDVCGYIIDCAKTPTLIMGDSGLEYHEIVAMIANAVPSDGFLAWVRKRKVDVQTPVPDVKKHSEAIADKRNKACAAASHTDCKLILTTERARLPENKKDTPTGRVVIVNGHLKTDTLGKFEKLLAYVMAKLHPDVDGNDGLSHPDPKILGTPLVPSIFRKWPDSLTRELQDVHAIVGPENLVLRSSPENKTTYHLKWLAEQIDITALETLCPMNNAAASESSDSLPAKVIATRRSKKMRAKTADPLSAPIKELMSLHWAAQNASRKK